jgi:hypothetical protein
LPNEINAAATALGKEYAKSKIRPKLDREILAHWNSLIDEWSDAEDLPLFIRKQSANIGDLLIHSKSGRKLAPCDNSPAHWAIITAWNKGVEFTIEDVRVQLKIHAVPVCMVMNPKEVSGATMKGVCAKQSNASKLGWTVDHIHAVKLGGQSRRIEDTPLESLKKHFRLLMKPSNIVLVPSALKGLGDLPAFLDIVKRENAS